MSLDIIGPYCKSGDETVSHLRYLLVACLLVPVDEQGRPVLGENQQHQSEEEEPQEREAANVGSEERDEADDIPAWDDLWGGVSALDEQEPLEPDQEALDQCRKDGEGMSAAERDCKVPGLRLDGRKSSS